MRRTVVDGKKGSGRKAGEGRVTAGTHGWVWPARSPRRDSSCGQTAQPPWRPSLPGRVASDCVGGRPRGRREKHRGVCQTEHLDISSNREACVLAYGGIVWGEDKTRFFPKTVRPYDSNKKGVVAQMVERPLCMRKVGGSMPSYSKSYFAFFSLTGSRTKPELRFPEASDDAGLRPCREKSHVSRFFLFFSGRLFPRFGQSGTVVAQSEPSFPSFGRESLALRVITCE